MGPSMTVTELLQRIMAAYAGATNEAMKTFVPVFHARLRKHEGERLEAAAVEVFGSFKPKYDHRFPIPADFEAHLPSGKLDLGRDSGPAIRQWLSDRERRSKDAYAEWAQGQGNKIKANRPQQVYAACQHMAMELTRSGRRVTLSAEQIRVCEERALCQERVRMFGPPPRVEDTWAGQIEQVREAWRVA